MRGSALKSAGGFRPRLLQLGDYDLWVRLAAAGEFHILPEPLTRMRLVGDLNLSYPSAPATRCLAVEHVEVLMRYAASPLLELLPGAFADVLPAPPQPASVNLAGLARHARYMGAAHRLFVDRVLGRLLDDPVRRREITEAYGTGIVKDFINNRSRMFYGFVDLETQPAGVSAPPPPVPPGDTS